MPGKISLTQIGAILQKLAAIDYAIKIGQNKNRSGNKTAGSRNVLP